jgi:hypothetical protein
MQRVPVRAEGHSLDLDSTIFERYGRREGSLKGHNPRQHGRPSHHPLLAVLPEAHFTLPGWATQRRFVVIGERVRESRASVGRKLIEVPGDPFRSFATSLDGPPEEIWHDYNRRADIENRIGERKHDLKANHFCLKQFHATEAAFRAGLLRFNLLDEFQRAAGKPGYREPAAIHTPVLNCGAILGRWARRLVVHPGESWGSLKMRKPLLASILEWEIPTSPKLILAMRCCVKLGRLHGLMPGRKTVQRRSSSEFRLRKDIASRRRSGGRTAVAAHRCHRGWREFGQSLRC